ncbi:hypothetical protein BDQ17DRAFT_1517733 [Cyathus striatus]|nr:hypothetical protein BDQ17DRAFT_1517733 [Cyathus striatus]
MNVTVCVIKDLQEISRERQWLVDEVKAAEDVLTRHCKFMLEMLNLVDCKYIGLLTAINQLECGEIWEVLALPWNLEIEAPTRKDTSNWPLLHSRIIIQVDMGIHAISIDSKDVDALQIIKLVIIAPRRRCAAGFLVKGRFHETLYPAKGS